MTETSTKLMDQLFAQVYDLVTKEPAEADQGKLPAGEKRGGRFSVSNTAIHIALPGIALYEDDFRDMYTLGNPNGVKSRTAAFSVLVDSIPAVGSSRYVQTPKRVSQAYSAVMAGANAVGPPLDENSDIGKMLAKMDKFLYHMVAEEKSPFADPGDPDPEPTLQKTTTYQRYEELIEQIGEAEDQIRAVAATASSKADWQADFDNDEINAMDDAEKNRLGDRALKASENYWTANSSAPLREHKKLVRELDGDKNNKYVQQALEYQATHGNELSRALIDKAKKLALLGDWTAPGSFVPIKLAFPSSTKFADMKNKDGWTTMTLSTEDYHKKEKTLSVKVSAGGGVNLGLWRVKTGAGYERNETSSTVETKSMKAELELSLVNISRPWMDATIFSDYVKWNAGSDQAAGSVSSGDIGTQTDSHFLPFIPMQMIVARNVKLIADWSKEEKEFVSNASSSDTSVGYGPFSVNASHKHSDSDFEEDRKGAGAGLKFPGIQCLGFVSWVPPKSAPIDGESGKKIGPSGPPEHADQMAIDAAAIVDDMSLPPDQRKKLAVK